MCVGRTRDLYSNFKRFTYIGYGAGPRYRAAAGVFREPGLDPGPGDPGGYKGFHGVPEDLKKGGGYDEKGNPGIFGE